MRAFDFLLKRATACVTRTRRVCRVAHRAPPAAGDRTAGNGATAAAAAASAVAHLVVVRADSGVAAVIERWRRRNTRPAARRRCWRALECVPHGGGRRGRERRCGVSHDAGQRRPRQRKKRRGRPRRRTGLSQEESASVGVVVVVACLSPSSVSPPPPPQRWSPPPPECRPTTIAVNRRCVSRTSLRAASTLRWRAHVFYYYYYYYHYSIINTWSVLSDMIFNGDSR